MASVTTGGYLFLLSVMVVGALAGAAANSLLERRRVDRLHMELYRLKHFDAALMVSTVGDELHLTVHYKHGAHAEACAQLVREGIEWALERGMHNQLFRPRLKWSRE